MALIFHPTTHPLPVPPAVLLPVSLCACVVCGSSSHQVSDLLARALSDLEERAAELAQRQERLTSELASSSTTMSAALKQHRWVGSGGTVFGNGAAWCGVVQCGESVVCLLDLRMVAGAPLSQDMAQHAPAHCAHTYKTHTHTLKPCACCP